MPETRDDELYTGYLPHAPPGIAAHVRRTVVLLFVFALTVAVVLVFGQQRFSAATFEYGVVRQFEGVVRAGPPAVLEVDRPRAGDPALRGGSGEDPALRGGSGEDPALRGGSGKNRSRYTLVAPGKHGASREVAPFDGMRVRLRGSLVYRGDLTLVEVVPGSIVAVDEAPAAAGEAARQSLGVHTLRGRIVDSKCYLGVMKPGAGKPHRACAAFCIRGGIPPLFVVADGRVPALRGGSGETGPAAHLMLLGADGRAVNAQILDLVDEPLEITGEVFRHDDSWILEADPATYRRLSSPPSPPRWKRCEADPALRGGSGEKRIQPCAVEAVRSAVNSAK